MAGNSIPDFPAASTSPPVDTQVPVYQTTGAGTPASTTYQATIRAWMMSRLMGLAKAVSSVGSTTLLKSDYYVPCDPTGGAVLLSDPTPKVDGQELFIKDVTGTASGTNYIQFAGNIEGTTNQQITIAFGWFKIRYDAVQAKWFQGA